jgi:hypothetical protein
MTILADNHLESLPSLSTTELGPSGGASHDQRRASSRGTSISYLRDWPHQPMPSSSSTSVLSAQDQDRSRKMAPSAVKNLDSSSPSSRPRPLQEDGLIRHEECHDDLKATKTGVHCKTTVLNFIVNPRDWDIRNSSYRNGVTLRPGGS